MARQKTRKDGRKRKGWIIFLSILSLLFFALLELSKNTIFGWCLAVLVIVGFCILMIKVPMKGGFRFLSFIGLLVCFGLVYLVSYPPVKPVPAVDARNPEKTEIVHLPEGDIQGVKTADGRVEVFTGIPYAKPPVGELRFREPEPAEPWDGVLLCDHFAPMSMQTVRTPLYSSLAQIIGYHDYKISLKDNYRAPRSEDSLYLNIWKPAGTQEKLPVLVYIHGGTLQTGQPWYADYSGESIARDGILVVNMHYRLGIFGFYADPELKAESENGSTGNYGFLDQILALHWVQDHIALFGGDPDNVTIAGESAGSACVSAHCTSPLSKGLFRRAVMESSTVAAQKPAHSWRSLSDAYDAAENTKTRFGIQSVAELRALPAEKIAPELSIHHYMTIDDYAFTETPYESYKKGIHNEEAQLHGYNLLEAAPFVLFSQADLSNYSQRVGAMYPDLTDFVLQQYPSATDQEARDNWCDLYTVYFFSYGHYMLQQLAKENNIPAYVYHFTKANGRLSSWHSGEEVYLYGNIPEDSKLYTARDRELSGQMKAYYENFVRTGDPNGEGLPEWPLDDAGSMVMEFGDETGMKQAPHMELMNRMLEKGY